MELTPTDRAVIRHGSYTGLLAVIDPMLDITVKSLDTALRGGKPTTELDKRLHRLLGLRKAAATFSPEQIRSTHTYLSITYGKPVQ